MCAGIAARASAPTPKDIFPDGFNAAITGGPMVSMDDLLALPMLTRVSAAKIIL